MSDDTFTDETWREHYPRPQPPVPAPTRAQSARERVERETRLQKERSRAAMFRELERIRHAIAKSPKTRPPHPDDVETFEESYNNCGLRSRWGGGRPVIER